MKLNKNLIQAAICEDLTGLPYDAFNMIAMELNNPTRAKVHNAIGMLEKIDSPYADAAKHKLQSATIESKATTRIRKWI